MIATNRPPSLKSRPGIRTALLLLTMATIGGDGSGALTSIDGSIASSDGVVGADEPIDRSYPPGFLETLGRLESTDPEALPEPMPGKLVVTLSSRPQNNAYRVSLDTSQQVFSFSAPDKVDAFEMSGLAASMAASDSDGWFTSGRFRSASLLSFKAKQFDDGLYAAVELAVDRGAGKFGSRRSLLADLASALKAGPGGAGADGALRLLSAATNLDGHPMEDSTTTLAQKFLADPLRSKPIGFYTWSRDLVRIFQRDRMLQTQLNPGTAGAFAGVLGSDASLLARYRAALRLPERLTNGFANEALAGAAAEFASGRTPALPDLSLFPASRAYETDLIKKLYGNKHIPDGFNLADEMVRRIQLGSLNLEPREDSGWYDYQTHALEPLVIPDRMPESRHLRLDDSYKKELVELFKGLLALTRETHIKQLEVPLTVGAAFGSDGAAPPPPRIVLTLSPRLSQEPLASFYLRRALSYRFVRGVLVESFGDAALSGMMRLTADGTVNLTLDRELRVMESLFYGAYLNTARELGMTPERHADLGLGEARSLALWRDWKPREDVDLSQDIRMMVPLFFDAERGKTKVWVVMGVTSRPIHVTYSATPVLESVTDHHGNSIDLAKVDFKVTDATFEAVYPVMAEIYVTEILDRREFRALCDQHGTQQAILEHLK